LYCTGKGGPPVILDAGSGGWSVHWSSVQKALAETIRVCSYDRAGLGWSEPGPPPRTAARAADELNRLLSRSGEKGPFIIAGQSYGGYVARIFADRHPKMVAAVVLVESAHEKQWERLPGVREMLEAHLTQFRDNVAKARAGQLKKEDFSNDDVPPDALPAYQASMLRPETHEAILSENESAIISAGQVATTKPLGERLLVVLSAGNSFAWFIEPTEANRPLLQELNRVWAEMQVELAGLSTKSIHIVSEDSTHGINREQPGVVADAIRQAIAAVRNR
jgi:pimeloyl-ACP methyl ester carboxylesterase